MNNIVEIQNCEVKLLQAIKENNLAFLDELIHPEVRFINPMGQIITKELDMANYGSGQIHIDEINASEQAINFIENTAIVTVKIKITGKYMEHVLDSTFQYLRIWQRQESSWKIIGGSSVQI